MEILQGNSTDQWMGGYKKNLTKDFIFLCDGDNFVIGTILSLSNLTLLSYQ